MYTTLKFKQKNLFFSCADDVQMPSSPLLPTLHTHITTHTLVPPPLYFFYRQNPQKHLLSRSKCQLIILPKHVFNWSTGEQLESGFSRHGARRMKAKVGRGGGGGGWEEETEEEDGDFSETREHRTLHPHPPNRWEKVWPAAVITYWSRTKVPTCKRSLDRVGGGALVLNLDQTEINRFILNAQTFLFTGNMF